MPALERRRTGEQNSGVSLASETLSPKKKETDKYYRQEGGNADTRNIPVGWDHGDISKFFVKGAVGLAAKKGRTGDGQSHRDRTRPRRMSPRDVREATRIQTQHMAA